MDKQTKEKGFKTALGKVGDVFSCVDFLYRALGVAHGLRLKARCELVGLIGLTTCKRPIGLVLSN